MWRKYLWGVIGYNVSAFKKLAIKMTSQASRELKNCWWEVDACSCWYIIRTDTSTHPWWWANAVWVVTVGLICCSCQSCQSSETDPRSRRENLWSFFHGLQYSQPPWGLLEMQSGSWRRKEENNCMQLYSLVFSVVARLHLKSSPPHHLLCSVLLTLALLILAVDAARGWPNNRLSSGCACVFDHQKVFSSTLV